MHPPLTGPLTPNASHLIAQPDCTRFGAVDVLPLLALSGKLWSARRFGCGMRVRCTALPLRCWTFQPPISPAEPGDHCCACEWCLPGWRGGWVIKDIGSALPCDSPEKVFQTLIAWGRYAGLMDFNAGTGMVSVPKNEDSAEDPPT